MKNSGIPNIVVESARNEGYNHIEFVCDFYGSQAFSVGIKDENGMFEPIGLPRFLLLKDNHVRYANQIENEQICKKL